MKYIIIALVITLATSCICQKKTSKDQEPKVTKTVSQSRFIVSFFSRGGGIDHDLKREFTSFLQTNYADITYNEVKWGREGEVDYCFELTELDSKKTDTFIQQATELVSESKLIRIKENETCRTPR